jgi:Uncharacterised protein family UPF0547
MTNRTDVGQLHPDIQKSLLAMLAEQEHVRLALRSWGKSGLVVTDNQVLSCVSGQWQARPRELIKVLAVRSEGEQVSIRLADSSSVFVDGSFEANGLGAAEIGIRLTAATATAVTESLKPVIVRSYETGPHNAGRRGREQYEHEAAALAAKGYEVVSTAAADKVSALGLTIGTLTVTYRLKPSTEAADGSRATKVCPDCAETVLAAARICRFCRHAFPSSDAAEDIPPANT